MKTDQLKLHIGNRTVQLVYLFGKTHWSILNFRKLFLTAAGFSDTQRNRNSSGQDIFAVQFINKVVYSHSAHEDSILLNGCKRWFHTGCTLTVIKTGDQDIFSYFETTFFTNTISGKCHFIVGEDNSLGICILCRTGYKKYFLTIVSLDQMLHDQLDALSLSVVTDQRMAVMRMDDLRKEHGRNGIEFAGKFLSSLIF